MFCVLSGDISPIFTAALAEQRIVHTLVYNCAVMYNSKELLGGGLKDFGIPEVSRVIKRMRGCQSRVRQEDNGSI